MRAMIFAAGLGTRLKPLTNEKPKALVPVNGEPLLLKAVRYLESYGIADMVINTHHFSDQIIDFCDINLKNSNIIISDESKKLLDTGGGVKKVTPWLRQSKEPVVVINADVVTNLDLTEMLNEHQESGNMATLAVRDRESSRKLIFNENKELVGWKNLNSGELKEVKQLSAVDKEFAFSGVHIISPDIFKLFPSADAFSIIDFYLSIAATNKVGAYIHDNDYWFDVGAIDKLKNAELFLKNINNKEYY